VDEILSHLQLSKDYAPRRAQYAQDVMFLHDNDSDDEEEQEGKDDMNVA